MMNLKRHEETFFKVLMILSAVLIMSILFYIIGTIIYKGLPSLSWDMISKLPGGGFYLGKEGGVLNAIIGSVYVILGALAISMFLSIPLVMYINFYLPKIPCLQMLSDFHLIFFLEYLL
jgi:phosphate transport system permease protein